MTPSPLARAVARSRPAADPGCAGCSQLGLLRALRRAGLEVQGALGCDPARAAPLVPAAGRWAAVVGAKAVLADAAGLLASSVRAGAALVVVADPRVGAAGRVAASLAAAGAPAVRIDPADLAAAERSAQAAADARGPVLVALSACARGAPRSVAFAIAPSRCNHCGACLALGCPAISDPGGDALAIDAATCTGCGLCAPLCRGRAIAR